MTEPQGPAAAGAVRLVFEYEGDDVRLVSQQPVDVAISGFDAHQQPLPGHYVETRDGAGTRIARVQVRGAFAESAEVFPEDHSEPISRVDAPMSGAFTVVIPAPAAVEQVAVVRVAPQPAADRAPGAGATSPAPGATDVQELATFRLER